jgi:hypothetical protein
MNYIKNTSIEELKRDFSDNHGFVFLNSNSSSDRSIETLAQTLKNQGITSDLPVLVTRLEHGIAFVYNDFDSPQFYERSDQIEMMTGIKIIPLFYYLKQV